jgi:hypothetical protein
VSALKKQPLCTNCILDGGWDYSEPDNPRRCDHGVLAEAVEAAERADRDRFCPSCDDGYGPCRCTS